MEPAVLLKHVAEWSQGCLPATQHVAAAQNKSESVKAANTDRATFTSIEYHHVSSAPATPITFISKNRTCKSMKTISVLVCFSPAARSSYATRTTQLWKNRRAKYRLHWKKIPAIPVRLNISAAFRLPIGFPAYHGPRDRCSALSLHSAFSFCLYPNSRSNHHRVVVVVLLCGLFF